MRTIRSILQGVAGTLTALSLAAVPVRGATFAQPETGKVDVGDGFQMAEGTKRITCLKNPLPDKSPRPYQLVTFDLGQVASIADMQKVLSISASAKFGGGLWSAQGSASWMSSSYYHSTSVNFSVRVHVENEEEKIKRPELDPKIDLMNRVKFFKRCGDGFVSSIQTGGEFIAIYHFEASTEEEASKFAAEISSGSISGNGFSAAMGSAMRQFKSDSRLSIQIVRKGPIGEIPELTPDGIAKYAREFPPKVATNGGNPYPVSFEVTPYSVFGIDPPDVDSAIRDYVIIRLAQGGDTATSRFDQLQYVFANSLEFSFTNKISELDALQKEALSLINYTDRLREAYRQCADLQKLCSLALLPQVPDIRVPVLLSKVGGCTEWSIDNKQCLECRYTAGQRGVSQINEGSTAFDALCRNMPPQSAVDITLEGSVGCGFMNNFGNHCGENGNVEWWIILNLIWKTGATGAQTGSAQFTHANIHTPTYGITISGKTTVPVDGLVSTQLNVAHVQMWPNSHGPLTLDPSLWVRIRSTQYVPLSREDVERRQLKELEHITTDQKAKAGSKK